MRTAARVASITPMTATAGLTLINSVISLTSAGKRGAGDLGQHDEAEAQAARHAEGACGIELVGRKSEQRGAPDFAIIGHRPQRQRGDAGGEAGHLEPQGGQGEIHQQHQRHRRRGAQQADESGDAVSSPRTRAQRISARPRPSGVPIAIASRLTAMVLPAPAANAR